VPARPHNGANRYGFVIASALSEFTDAATLKKDGRRVSLEGVLTGAALGIMLLYLTEEALASGGPRAVGGRLDDPGEEDPGSMRARAGRVDILPLDNVDIAFNDRRPPAFGGNGDGGLPQGLGEIGSGGQGAPGRPQELPGLPPPSLPFYGANTDNTIPFGGGGGRGGGNGRGSGSGSGLTPSPEPSSPIQPVDPITPAPTPPGPPPPRPPEPPGPKSQLPQMLLVVVRTDGNAASRSIDSMAMSDQSARQVGIENSYLDLRSFGVPNLELLSARTLQSIGVSQLDDADLRLIADHVGLLNSTVLNGIGSDVMIFDARDLLELGLLSSGNATANVSSRTAGMENSNFKGIGGNDLFGLEGVTRLNFTGLGNTERAALSFNLLTEALKGSTILLGSGDDKVTINSGFYSLGGSTYQPQSDGGLNFDFGQTPTSNGDGSNWSFSLNAKAVGLDNSLIDLGAGDDDLTILTRIDQNLNDELGILFDDPHTSIQLERIGMNNSVVSMGEGNDHVRINGKVINSTIDLGNGDNTLILEGDVLGDSRIVLGNGSNMVTINSALGGVIQGGEGNDLFNLRNLQLAGEVDGGGGIDTLAAGGQADLNRDLLKMDGINGGNLGGLRFRNVETMQLGGGDDVILLSLDGTLTGQLLGGDGLDRLEYSNWTLPVTVDLDRGQATAIGGGIAGSLSGVEQVIGGLGNDTLISSGAFGGIDGSEGDDLLFVRWNPWNSQPEAALQVRGGTGKDLFVFSGLEQPTPVGWDGQSGLPDLVDLDLSKTQNGAISSNTDSIGWLRTETDSGGNVQQSFLRLTPSGLEGIGNSRMLPIAPLEQLLSGMASDTRQLAIAWDGVGDGQMVLLGSQGEGTSQKIANVLSPLGLSDPSSFNG